MDNSLFLRHQSLMKRRFSVPETVMRKHNLQDLTFPNPVSDSVILNTTSSSSNLENSDDGRPPRETNSSPIHEEYSWLDDDPKLVASSKRNTGVSRSRKRKSFRLLRKSSSSYCQYRYTMNGFSKQILGRRASKSKDRQLSLVSPPDETIATENTDCTYSLEYTNEGNSVELEAGQSDRLGPNKNVRRLPEIREFPACPRRTTELITNGCGDSAVVEQNLNTTNCTGTLKNLPTDFPLIVQSESVFHHPSQPTGCSTRETHSISIEILPSYAESSHPETKNYFRTAVRVDREVRAPRGSESPQFEYSPTGRSSQKRDVRTINEIETRHEGTSQGFRSCSPKWAIDSKNDDWTTFDSGLTRVKLMNEVKARPLRETRSGSIKSNSDSEDCAVPASILDSLAQKDAGSQQLNIQVSVGKMGALENSLLTANRKETVTDVLPPCSNDVGQKSSVNKDECKTKVALNYLFQKLGDAYPKPQNRLLLKEPTFANYRSQSQFGQYYSGLPKLSDTPPVNLMYKCDIVPTKSLPDGRKTYSTLLPEGLVTKRLIDEGEHNSDSDISIADSLEDSQQYRTTDTLKDRNESNPATNRYCKYDERLARGDVDKLVQALRLKESTPSERTVVNGVSYFLQFSNVENGSEGGDSNVHQEIVDHVHAPHIPNNLLEKLNRRSNSISKHSYCLGACKSREFVHKQIQTCFNAQESLRRKRRTRITERATTLDKRIAKILMTGLEMQEGPKAELLRSRPSACRVTDECAAGESYTRSSTSDGPTSTVNASKVEGIYWFRYSTDRAEKEDTGGENVPNVSKFRYQKNKLKYFEERKVRKQREDNESVSGDDDLRPAGDQVVLRKPAPSHERRSPPTKARNSKPKVFGTRFRQKFEAIPEEIANSLGERYDDVNISNCVEQMKDKSTCGPKPVVDDEQVDRGECESHISVSNLETDVDKNNDFLGRSAVITESHSNIRVGNDINSNCIYCKETPNRFRPNIAIGGNSDSNLVEGKDRLSAPDVNLVDDENNEKSKVDPPVMSQSIAAEDVDDDKDLSERDLLPSSSDAVLDSNSARKIESKNEKAFTVEEKNTITEAEAAPSESKVLQEGVKSAVDIREKESQNRRDLLYSGNAKEELITLSKGWINFYLLKAGNVGADDGSSNLNEDVDRDSSATSSEDAQQYSLHIQAVPELYSTSNVFSARQRTRTLPDLSQLLEAPSPQRLDSKWYNVSSKTNNSSSPEMARTPDLNHRVINSPNPRDECRNTELEAISTRYKKVGEDNNSSPVPKLSPSSLEAETDSTVRTEIDPQSTSRNPADAEPISSATIHESEIVSRSQNGDVAAASSFWSESTSIMNVRSTASSSATSDGNSNGSMSSVASNEIGMSVVHTDDAVVMEDDGGVGKICNSRSRKTQYNLRPQTYHSTSRQDYYRRSVSVEGNRKSGSKKNSSGTVDIEMRLLVKNRAYQDENGNRTHSWKFTLTSDDSSNVNKNERSSSRSRYAFCTPNRNSSHFQNQTRIVKLSGCSETTSTSTSTCSLNERKRNKEAKFSAKYELSSYPLRSNNNLAVTGSSITPETKPKPPTMSERDLTRSRFSKYATTNNINKL